MLVGETKIIKRETKLIEGETPLKIKEKHC